MNKIKGFLKTDKPFFIFKQMPISKVTFQFELA
jgi:hypothetical protein